MYCCHAREWGRGSRGGRDNVSSFIPNAHNELHVHAFCTEKGDLLKKNSEANRVGSGRLRRPLFKSAIGRQGKSKLTGRGVSEWEWQKWSSYE